MRVAVTGGSGVVGRALVEAMVNDGYDVTALVRSANSGASLAGLGARPVHGDVLDPESLDALAGGCEVLYHVAGVVETCSKNPSAMWKVNVEGTRHVLDAARRSGLRRMVLTSSVAAIGEECGVRATEQTRHSGEHLSIYARSKCEAERLAFRSRGDVEVVAVNPASVQGRGRATGTAAMLVRAAMGKVPLAVETVVSIVDVEDCARGHILAGERGASGERYILSGASLKVSELLELVGDIVGKDLSPRYLSTRQLRMLAKASAPLSRLAKGLPYLCDEAVRVMTHTHDFDGGRATRELGLRYTSIERTLRRAVDWFRSERLLS